MDNHNISNRKAKHCVGCNIKDRCKHATEGRLCPENPGMCLATVSKYAAGIDLNFLSLQTFFDKGE